MARVDPQIDTDEWYARRNDLVRIVASQTRFAHPEKAFAVIPNGMGRSAKYLLVACQLTDPLYVPFAICKGRVPKEERTQQFQQDLPCQIALANMLGLMTDRDEDIILLRQQPGWQNDVMPKHAPGRKRHRRLVGNAHIDTTDPP